MEEQNSEAKKGIPMRLMFSSGWQQRWRRRFQSHRGGDGEDVGRKKGDRDILATRSPPSPPLPSSRSSRITPDTRMEGEMAEERGGAASLSRVVSPSPTLSSKGGGAGFSRLLPSPTSPPYPSPPRLDSSSRLPLHHIQKKRRGQRGREGGGKDPQVRREGKEGSGKKRENKGGKKASPLKGSGGVEEEEEEGCGGGGLPPFYIFQSQKPPLLPFPFFLF